LLVNPFLQSTTYPELFGGGDCISLAGNPLAKVGVYAVRQNPVLLHNLMAALEGGSLNPFRPGGTYMLIMNMGNGTGIFWKKNLVLNGRPAFLLKDFIDRRFMKKFQVSGELEEPGGEII
jgi:NADH dehydrogenase FAD-containing subunit